jgi:hypothetical protein
MIGQDDNKVVFNGNGTTTQFPYGFKILNEADLKLIYVDRNGKETLLTSDYYVNMEQGYVTYPGYAPGAEPPEYDQPPILAYGERLVVYRETPMTQNADLGNRYPFNVIEQGLDKLTLITQELADGEARSLKLSNAFVGDVDTTIPVEAGKALRWNEVGTKLELTEDPAKVLTKAQAVLEDTINARDKAIADIEAEKQNIVEEVIASLPIYNGEVIEV